jgi:hypothetical protein
LQCARSTFPFDARRIFVAQLGLAQRALSSVEGRERLARDLTARLDATPGVTASALVSVVPGRGAGNWSFSLDAPPSATTIARQPTTGVVMITPGFFDVVGARVLRGRGIDEHDRPGAPIAAVVNTSWVRRFSPDREPLGRKIWLGKQTLEVVGVVPDLQMQDPEDKLGDGVYVSLLQLQPFAIRVLARTQGDPLALTNVVRDAVEAIDPDLPLFEVSSLYDAIYSDKKVLDAFGALFFAAGVGALLLTMVGLYGIVSFAGDVSDARNRRARRARRFARRHRASRAAAGLEVDRNWNWCWLGDRGRVVVCACGGDRVLPAGRGVDVCRDRRGTRT